MNCIRCGKEADMTLCYECVEEGLKQKGFWSFCPLCGRIYLRVYGCSTKIFCSKICQVEYQRQVKKFRKCWNNDKSVDIQGFYAKMLEFSKDLEGKEKEYEEEKREYEERRIKNSINKRRCHDCGKLTVDYRCEKCQRKWRKKNNVKNEGDIEEGSCDFDV